MARAIGNFGRDSLERALEMGDIKKCDLFTPPV